MDFFFFFDGGTFYQPQRIIATLVLSVKALSLLTSLTCPEAGILAGIFSVISFCTHMPSWKGGQQAGQGDRKWLRPPRPPFILCTTS